MRLRLELTLDQLELIGDLLGDLYVTDGDLTDDNNTSDEAKSFQQLMKKVERLSEKANA